MIRGQSGLDSDQTQAVELKKKSERKRLIPFLFEDAAIELTQNRAVGAIPCGQLKLDE
ncbi:hypothetical protein [Nostoc sp.]|uniref:hypothetical protein n=1 Tax=Nostoc sp. TaxID=1180 RepID=UPI003FA5AA24